MKPSRQYERRPASEGRLLAVVMDAHIFTCRYVCIRNRQEHRRNKTCLKLQSKEDLVCYVHKTEIERGVIRYQYLDSSAFEERERRDSRPSAETGH